jgi:hypothetical protein
MYNLISIHGILSKNVYEHSFFTKKTGEIPIITNRNIFFFSFSKAKLLVSELLTSEIWRENVIPIMTKTDDFKPISTIPLYLSLYNEAVIGQLGSFKVAGTAFD